MTTLL
jgi:hypothetical protein